MIKPMECPKCGQQPEIYSVNDAGVFCVHAVHANYYNWSGTTLGAILRWNAYCRRELHRMRKEIGNDGRSIENH